MCAECLFLGGGGEIGPRSQPVTHAIPSLAINTCDSRLSATCCINNFSLCTFPAVNFQSDCVIAFVSLPHAGLHQVKAYITANVVSKMQWQVYILHASCCIAEGLKQHCIFAPGADEWNPMIQAMIISCAGLVQYLIDAYPPDLPHYDPL